MVGGCDMRRKFGKKVLLSAMVCALSIFGLGESAVPIDGGVTDETDYHTPKVIISKEITEFYVHAFIFNGSDGGKGGVYTFTVKKEGSVLMASESHSGSRSPADKKMLRELQAVIDKHELAKRNGTYHITAGLPAEFQPCDFEAVYASGEVLRFTIDSEPDAEWAKEIYLVFAKWFAKKGIGDLPL